MTLKHRIRLGTFTKIAFALSLVATVSIAFAVNPNSVTLQGAIVEVEITSPADGSNVLVPTGETTVEGQVTLTNFTISGYEDLQPTIKEVILNLTPSIGAPSTIDLIAGGFFNLSSKTFSVPVTVDCDTNLIEVKVNVWGIRPEVIQHRRNVTADISIVGICEPLVTIVKKDYRYTNINLSSGVYGTLIPIDPDTNSFLLDAVLWKDGTVNNYNPGQYYAVTTVNVTQDLAALRITEIFRDCTDRGNTSLSRVNPASIPGGAIVGIIDEFGDFFDLSGELAKSGNLFFNDTDSNGVIDEANVYLQNISEGSTVLFYVKFAPGLKGMELPSEPDNMCTNEEIVRVEFTSGGEADASATATLIVKEKENGP